MHVERVEARAVERRRHLDLAVDALLAQDRDLRAARRVAMNGAATSSLGSNVSARRAGPDRRRRAMRAYSCVRARPGCRAGAASRASSTTRRDAGRCATRRAATRRRRANAHAIAGRRARRRSCAASPGLARVAHDARRRRAARTCTTAPSSSANSAASSIAGDRRASMSSPQRDANAISRERHEQAAVGDVVIGEQLAVACSCCDAREERREPRRIVEVRALRCRAGRTPAPAPSRRGGAGRRRGRCSNEHGVAGVAAQQRRQRPRARRAPARTPTR